MIRRYIKSQLQGRTGTCFRRTGTKHSSSPASTTATRSWLDSLPPPSSLCSAFRPRQRDNLPKSSHVTPLFRDLQRLPVAARITFKTTVPTYKAVNGTAPTHLRALVRPHAPARALRATTSAGRPVPPSLRASKGRTAKSQLFSVLAPLWRTDLPADVRTAESETTCFRKRLKTTCSELTWTPLSLLPLLPLPVITKIN
ncbi:hypothetical protein N1851_007963 [Merluccius polli]|uniref:Uncharacterized protein n=1 Tax=Merluccius polli TaxID=89951 RepID=A0AA47N2Z6_MERPO|nr:hypothetical protein N1851_007963 [Merluccius polli]